MSSEEEDEELQFTGKLFGGLRQLNSTERIDTLNVLKYFIWKERRKICCKLFLGQTIIMFTVFNGFHALGYCIVLLLWECPSLTLTRIYYTDNWRVYIKSIKQLYSMSIEAKNRSKICWRNFYTISMEIAPSPLQGGRKKGEKIMWTNSTVRMLYIFSYKMLSFLYVLRQTIRLTKNV